MTDQTHPFLPGNAVIVNVGYSHYGPGTFRRDTVHKLHKNGQFTVQSEPQKRFRAFRQRYGTDGEEWIATCSSRDYSIYTTKVRLVSPASEKEMADGIEAAAHKARCRELERAFATPAKIPATLSKAVSDMLMGRDATEKKPAP
jgi:hypothetical protein